jgi:plasmid stability protein
MAILQVRDVDDRLYRSLKQRATQEHRSISQEVLQILDDYLSGHPASTGQQTDEFLALSWSGPEPAEAQIAAIRTSRKGSTRFRGRHGVFD